MVSFSNQKLCPYVVDVISRKHDHQPQGVESFVTAVVVKACREISGPSELTSSFFFKAGSRVEDTERLYKLFEVDDLILLDVKALEKLVDQDVTCLALCLEEPKNKFILVDETVLKANSNDD